MGIGDILIGVLNWQITINAAPLYSQRYANSNAVPFWLLVASFAVVFSVIWLASNNIPIFKKKTDVNTKGPRTMFTIALSLIALFGTPLALWIMWVVYTFSLLSIAAITILGIYVIWTLTREQWATNTKKNADSSKLFSDAKKTKAAAKTANAESERANEKTKEYKLQTKEATRKGLHFQLREIRKLQRDMGSIVDNLTRIKRRNVYPPTNTSLNRIAGDLSRLRQDLGHILSYSTNNDRIMSTMSTNNYTEGNIAGLTELHATNKTAHIKQAIETETNDLGHTLSAMGETIQTTGIPDITTINRLLSWGDVAINIAKRMERDVVLEEQMIEKI
ncbi:MAG: hypothetical protein WC758_00415 [Candidatus Woesearchaeota archaeon]